MTDERTTVSLPDDLLAQVDEFAGSDGRSRYISEAVERRVKRDRLGKVLDESRGAVVGQPGQRTAEQIPEDFRELRQADRDR